jgi:hypothetical protein
MATITMVFNVANSGPLGLDLCSSIAVSSLLSISKGHMRYITQMDAIL